MNKINYTKNTLGRDFVCGDLHGSYSRLVAAMEFLNFDKNADRMFSVGDLVDRGPQSAECLQLLNEPWFFAVRGNHEQLMDHYYTDGEYGRYWFQNGGGWAFATDPKPHILELSAKAAQLPVMITVERQDGKFFHVIHAELGSSNPITDLELDNPQLFALAAFKQSSDGDSILWGRWLFGSLYAKEITPGFASSLAAVSRELGHPKLFNPNLSHIYSGHTIMQRPTRIQGQTNLDTNAYGSYKEAKPWMGLTITEPLTDTFWLANGEGVTQVSLLQL